MKEKSTTNINKSSKKGQMCFEGKIYENLISNFIYRFCWTYIIIKVNNAHIT